VKSQKNLNFFYKSIRIYKKCPILALLSQGVSASDLRDPPHQAIESL
jgi:hypothetical protein